MRFGFFFWPFDPELVGALAAEAEGAGWDLLGIADTPGNAMDPWVAAALAAQSAHRPDIAICVTNLATRHPAVSAAAIASLDLLAPGRAILGLGIGHSGTRNLGLPPTPLAAVADGVRRIKQLLRGEAADGARLSWVERPSRVFLAASGPGALAVAGREADGVFVNFGITPEAVAQSQGAVLAAARAAGREPGELPVWQIAALDCSRDGGASRRQVGAILAFMAAGYVLGGNPAGRAVPEALHRPLLELRRRYSTRPGAADAALVGELGLFDYLSARFAVFGTPAECRAQLRRARAAGVERVMFTVSLAADPLDTVRRFGAEVLPAFR